MITTKKEDKGILLLKKLGEGKFELFFKDDRTNLKGANFSEDYN